MRAIILATLLSLPIVTSAATFDGNKLKEFSDAWGRANSGSTIEQDKAQAFIFYGYVMGVVDTMNGLALCTPANVTPNQLIAVVSKFLDKNPELWNRDAAMLVGASLAAAFPCK